MDVDNGSSRQRRPKQTAAPTAKIIHSSFDPEVLGGDTCDLGQCCLNPCGFLLGRLSQHQSLVFPIAINAFWVIIFFYVYPLQNDLPTISSYHKTIGYFVFLSDLCSWYIASRISPGTISLASLARFDNYHYDNVLYFENKICPTLHFRKLARSKYDRHSKTHVPRFDHHCPVLNQSVGEENYRFFIAFLMIHTATGWYGTTMLCYLLWGQVVLLGYNRDLAPQLTLRAIVPRLGAMCVADLFLMTLMLTLLVLSLFATAFLGFHLYLIARGLTTNEYYKWQDIAEQHQQYRDIFFEQQGRLDEEGCAALREKEPDPMPHNTYDLGICRNAIEVFFPRSLHQKRCKLN
jgi:hypothetical protein